jgi:hypothetical protein
MYKWRIDKKAYIKIVVSTARRLRYVIKYMFQATRIPPFP